MDSENIMKIVGEMIDFCEENDIISYYELKEYAFKNSKDEWVNALRDKECRTVVSEHLKSKKRAENRTYDIPRYKAMHSCFNAGAEYNKKKEQAFIKELDAIEDSVENNEK